MKRKVIIIIPFITLLIIIIFSLFFYFRFSKPSFHFNEDLVFLIQKGSNVSSIAQKLKKKHIIKEEWPFLLGYKLYFSSKTIKAGEYLLRPPLTIKEILKQITDGKIMLHPITIQEGLTRRETAELFHSASFINVEEFLQAADNIKLISDLDQNATNLEGYLFPETYHFPKNTAIEKIISSMVSQFKTIFSKKMQLRTKELGMTVREVVTLASLIEKETSLSDEKKIVSSVFHNRLRKGIKLDCDPTIIYALKEIGKFDGNLRRKDLLMDSPYNTYKYKELPPGPIANPGLESINAALYPAKTGYYYFVSKNDGSHHFSISFREHQNAVNLYQRKH